MVNTATIKTLRGTTIPTEPFIPAQGNGRRLLQRLPFVQEQVAAIINANIDSASHTNWAMVAALERRFREMPGVAQVFGMNSGSSALRAACELLQLPPGSEILLPGYTFVMTAYAVSDAFAVEPGSGVLSKGGLIPVFVDVDPSTYTIDPEQVQAAITERTRAIIVVHMLGQMGNMRPLLDIAKKYNLPLIEDAAQAHGASYHDPITGDIWPAGSVGHLGCYSLSDVKNIGSMGSDAGLLTITQRLIDHMPNIAERARAWRNTGRVTSRRYLHQLWGIRARMDEYSAAECLAELMFLEEWNARRREIAARYTSALNGSWLQAPFVAPECKHAFFAYMVKAPNAEAREDLVNSLREAGIGVADAYTVVADQALYRQGRLPCRVNSLEVSRALADLLVPIPCYPELSDSEIARIEAVLAAR